MVAKAEPVMVAKAEPVMVAKAEPVAVAKVGNIATKALPANATASPAESAILHMKCPEQIPAAILQPLPDRVHFAFDRADISESSADVIKQIAAAMTDEPDLRIILYGHTDQRGNLYYNMNLSLHRADNVRALLVKSGVPADRISVAPLGKLRPLTAGKSFDAYARNRRVEFFFTVGPQLPLVPQLDDLQPETTARRY